MSLFKKTILLESKKNRYTNSETEVSYTNNLQLTDMLWFVYKVFTLLRCLSSDNMQTELNYM